MTTHRQYVVGSDSVASADSVRAILRALRPRAVSFQCDLPFAQSERWPIEVRNAGALLLDAAPPEQQKRAVRGYAMTGALPVRESLLWEAFVEFAAYSYDASVWDEQGSIVADLADEGTSIVASLSDREAEDVRRQGVPLSLT